MAAILAIKQFLLCGRHACMLALQAMTVVPCAHACMRAQAHAHLERAELALYRWNLRGNQRRSGLKIVIIKRIVLDAVQPLAREDRTPQAAPNPA